MEPEVRDVVVEARNAMHEEIRKALLTFSAKTGLTVSRINYSTERVVDESGEVVSVYYWNFEEEVRV